MRAGARESRRAPRGLAILLCALAVAAAPSCRRAAADDSTAGDPSAEAIVLRRCVVEYERATGVGAGLEGILKACLVELGDRVEAGQVLGRLADDEVRAELDLRAAEAQDDVEVRLSEAKRDLAFIKLRTTEALRLRHAISREESNVQRMETEAAVLAVEQAKHHHRLTRLRLEQAKAMVRVREFVSPHPGIVMAILRHPGEPVAVHEPVFRVVDTDHLLVIGQVDVADAWRVQAGQSVRVTPEVAGADLAVEREDFSGGVVFIDGHVDPETRTSKVIAKIDNRDGLLRSGLEVRMEISPPAATVAPVVGMH